MTATLTTASFDHEYRGCDVLYGRGRIADLGAYLRDAGFDRALVVCGSNVGANDALMDPVREGLGGTFVGAFTGTTPTKRAETAAELLDAVAETDADVLVAVGGGSSLDVARQAGVLDADDRELSELRSTAETDGRVEQPTDVDPALPVVAVPTTFAGADLSGGGSLVVLPAAESPTGQPVLVSGSNVPIADVVDPALFETTPRSVLAGSAMNGFNKGIETPYASDASAVSDATAIHGLRYLSSALPRLVDGPAGSVPRAMDRAALGALLVQVDRKLSVIHAFGHGFSRRYDVQQGDVHAVLAPPVLRYVFESVDGNRRALAAGLGVDAAGGDDAISDEVIADEVIADEVIADEVIADEVIDAVAAVRDGLGRPARLRELPEVQTEDFPDIAAFVLDDPMMDRAPSGLEPTAETVEAVLREAW